MYVLTPHVAPSNLSHPHPSLERCHRFFFFNLLISLKIDTILRFSLMQIRKKIYAWRVPIHETCLIVAVSASAEWGYLKHLGSLQDSLFGQLKVSPKLPYFFIVVSEVRGTTIQSKLCMKWMNEWMTFWVFDFLETYICNRSFIYLKHYPRKMCTTILWV